MQYVRICNTLSDSGKLIPVNESFNRDHISNLDQDWYRSVYYYNQQHFDRFSKTNTIAGITDVTTNWVIFDFDSEQDRELARKDTLTVVSRLIAKGLNKDDISVFYSGNKGFSIELYTTSNFTPKSLKAMCKNLAQGMSTFDTKVYNASRIFRIPLTKHNKTGLYKVPVSLDQLSKPFDVIKAYVSSIVDPESIDINIRQIILPSSITKLAYIEPTIDIKHLPTPGSIDLSAKPKWLPACRYAIMNGHFSAGNRSHALMSLAATIKSQGIPKEVAYRMLKGAAELQAARTSSEPFAKEEIWNNIIGVVYSPTWNGATYSCKDHEFLQEVCPVANTDKCGVHKNEVIETLDNLHGGFKHFADNLENNRILTGIKDIDNRLTITAGSKVGVLASAGAGKTAIALNILKNTSEANVRSLFCSMDMGKYHLYAKMMSNINGRNFEENLRLPRTNEKEYIELGDKIISSYANMSTTFKNGMTVDDIREVLLKEQDRLGEKIKVILIDYLECLAGPYSDATANSGHHAAKIKDLANETETCVIVLLQPQKSAGDPSKPITSMRQVKGSSLLEQNFDIIMGLYREGFSPTTPERDRFITINALKNRFGPLFSVDKGWHGPTGTLFDLSNDDFRELKQLREDKKKENAGNSSDGGWD